MKRNYYVQILIIHLPGPHASAMMMIMLIILMMIIMMLMLMEKIRPIIMIRVIKLIMILMTILMMMIYGFRENSDNEAIRVATKRTVSVTKK